MKVTFINMNQLDGLKSANTIPIQSGYIAAYLNKHGHSSAILDDLKDMPLSLNVLNEHMQMYTPDLICFTGYHYLMERIRFYARFIKKYYAETRIVLGGPQALFLSGDALKDLPDFDVICSRGEGETTMLALAEAFKNNTNLRDIDGISFRDGKKIVTTRQPSRLPDDLDIYPSPYITGVINLKAKNKAILFTSRGCEHVCNFCVTPFFNRRRIRYHSIEHVLEEMRFLESKGIQSLWIGDPHFTASRERTVELMNQKIQADIRIPFWCQTRVDMVDEELLVLMKEAGLNYIGFGLESGCDKVLQTMNKNVDVDRFHRIVSFAQSLGIGVDLFSMYGQPGETVEDSKKTIDIVRQYNIPIYGNSHAQQLQLTCGSVYGKAPEKYGYKTSESYRPAYLSYWNDYETDTLSKRDIEKIQSLWTLHNAEKLYKLQNRIDLFHAIDFLETNSDALKDEKQFYEQGLYLGSVFEDVGLMVKYAEGYARRFKPDTKELSEFLSKAEVYAEDDSVKENSRVVIFCEYPSGQNTYEAGIKAGLNDFRHINISVLNGMKANESRVVHLNTFAGTSVKMTVLKVFRQLKIDKLKQLSRNNFRHNYGFLNFAHLQRSDDELLLFLALRDAPERVLLKMPDVYMSLVSFYTKMHRVDEVSKCFKALSAVHGREATAATFGDITAMAGRYTEAVKYYRDAESLDAVMLKHANALVNKGDYQTAYNILQQLEDNGSYLYNEIMLLCLKNLFPEDVRRIKQLDEIVLNTRVERAVCDSRLEMFDKKVV